ncbi:MAG: hypothetical protein DI537_10170 [Stutzerimonas stutzeri]|nr:MAG: hypothetical protein DI537_10170 [Stutzerimonas stutzeri]
MAEPYQKVTDPDYFRGVLGNMVGPKNGIKTRFGNRGDGRFPNYQTQDLGGQVRRYSGQSHQLYHEQPLLTFDPAHLSEGEFSYQDVQDLLSAALKARS